MWGGSRKNRASQVNFSNTDLGIRCRGILLFPLISTSHQALLLWGLFKQMTALMAAGGHQGLQLVAIAALWHAGRHRAAPSSVLRGDSCGVQAPRHLPVWRRDNNMQTPAAPLIRQHGFLGCVGCFLRCYEEGYSAALVLWSYLTWICHYES